MTPVGQIPSNLLFWYQNMQYLSIIFFTWIELLLTECFVRTNESWMPSGMPKLRPSYQVFGSGGVAIVEEVRHAQKLTQSFGKLDLIKNSIPEWAESKVANSKALLMFPGAGQLHSQYRDLRAVRRGSLYIPKKSNEGESGTLYWQAGPWLKSVYQLYLELFYGLCITAFGGLAILGTGSWRQAVCIWPSAAFWFLELVCSDVRTSRSENAT